MLITTNYQHKFKKQILKDYYLESEKQGFPSVLKEKSLKNIEQGNESKILCFDDNYINATSEYNKIKDNEHIIIYFIDDKNMLLSHASLYIPNNLSNVALLKKIYVRSEEDLNEVLIGNYSPLQCIYFKMIESAKNLLPSERELLFDEEAITKPILEVLKEEKMDYCKEIDLENKSEEKRYDKYEWSNFTRKRNKFDK